MLQIDKGVYTALTVDLSEFDFNNVNKVVFTIKNNVSEEPVIRKEFTSSGVYDFNITPEEAERIKNDALYDVSVITTEGTMFKVTESEPVVIREAVGRVKDIE